MLTNKDRWEKTQKTVGVKGTTIRYERDGCPYSIESRKRHIPHANGIGTWDYTSYFILKDGKDIVEKRSLKDAKEYVRIAEAMEDACD